MQYLKCLLAIALALAGCEDTTKTDMPSETSVTQSVVASEGATFSLDFGEVVTIPPGALESDAEVTVSRLRCAGITNVDGFGGCEYAVTTPGELVGRISVTLPSHRDAAPTCVMARSENGWRCLESTIDGEAATATSSGAYLLTTRTQRNRTSLNDDTCTDWVVGECGGDPTGTWELVRSCGTFTQVADVSWSGPDPYAACNPSDVYVAYPFSVSATLRFTRDQVESGSSQWAFEMSGSYNAVEHSVIATRCLDDVGQECHSGCVEENGACQCIWPKILGGGSRASGWSLGEGGEVYLEGSDEPLSHCIDGDTMAIEWSHPDGNFVEVYRRQ